MEKKKIPGRKQLLLLVIIMAATVALTWFVVAKYYGEPDVNGEANLQWFDVEIVDPNITDSEWDPVTGTITLTAAQYENFVLNIEKTGDGWAYVRVSVEESWKTVDTNGTQTAVASVGGTLNTANNIADNITDAADQNLYVEGIVRTQGTINVIAGSNQLPTDIGTTSNDYVVQLSIRVEAIQYNRLEEFWDLAGDPLP